MSHPTQFDQVVDELLRIERHLSDSTSAAPIDRPGPAIDALKVARVVLLRVAELAYVHAPGEDEPASAS